jgi:hypothetical protein
MQRRMVRTSLVFVAVLAIALITMAAIGAAAGSSNKKFGSTTTVSIGSQGTLASSPFGDGVNISVAYSCFPGFGGGKGGPGSYPGGGPFGSVQVADLAGNQGFGSFTPTCDDTRQTAVVFVQAFGVVKGPASFVAGDAAANALVCGFDCNITSREIKIS